jgi:dipeptidase
LNLLTFHTLGVRITTHNNDCVECDIRITKVPARDWPEGSKRPIQPIRAAYPRYIEHPEDSIHGPDYYIDNVDMTLYPWNATEPYYFIDQVRHTYAYTLGAYAIQNEKQVSIGESTCSSIFVATPVFDGGKAVMHLETLTELALERCDTARCAIQLMGDLAVQYGFFGPEWDGNLNAAQDESGEALTVSDPDEAW